MERRRRPRFAINQKARLQVLEKGGAQFEARLLDVSGNGMRFASDCSLPQDTLLKIEIGDAMLLAEVISCRPSESGFSIGVKVDQILAPLAELLRLQKALLAEQAPQPVEAPVRE